MGVDLLWSGRLLEFDSARKEVRQEDFWPIPDRAPDATMDEDGLAAVLEEGLRLHLASDVPLAVFLSGGVDSSVMANLAQRAAGSVCGQARCCRDLPGSDERRLHKPASRIRR